MFHQIPTLETIKITKKCTAFLWLTHSTATVYSIKILLLHYSFDNYKLVNYIKHFVEESALFSYSSNIILIEITC